MAMKRRCRASPQGPVFGYYGDIGECRNRVFIDQRRTDNYREAVIRKSLFAWEERKPDTFIHCRFAVKETMFHERGVFRCRLSSG